jgi:hypothetical protein
MNNKEYFEKLSSYPHEYKFYVQDEEKIDFIKELSTVGDMVNHLREDVAKYPEKKIFVNNKEASGLEERMINEEKAVVLF